MRPAPVDLPTFLSNLPRPSRVVVTAGMPYANGPLHIGHLAGAHVPADVFARWMAMLVGRQNVLFVCGTDDHGSTSEIAAAKAGRPIRDFIDGIHDQQQETLRRYAIGLDTYTGTSRPETRPRHLARVQEMFRALHANGMLEKRTSEQWYDPVADRFLPDRLVRGTCPNPKCGNPEAYSDECEVCGSQYDPHSLGDPRSAISDATPIMKETVHWWLDLWKVAEVLREWVQTRKNVWRGPVFQQVLNTVLPSLRFDNVHEASYKAMKSALPPRLIRKQLSGFMSRWMTPFSCASLSELRICAAMSTASCTPSSCSRIAWLSVRPSRYSMAKNSRPSLVSPKSMTRTVLGCTSRLMVFASRWKR